MRVSRAIDALADDRTERLRGRLHVASALCWIAAAIAAVGVIWADEIAVSRNSISLAVAVSASSLIEFAVAVVERRRRRIAEVKYRLQRSALGYYEP